MYIPGGIVSSYYVKTFTDTAGHKWRPGVPIEPKYVDDPNYFRQITSGNEENDVIHGKLVSALGPVNYYNIIANNGWEYHTSGQYLRSSQMWAWRGVKNGLVSIQVSIGTKWINPISGYCITSIGIVAYVEYDTVIDQRRALCRNRLIAAYAGDHKYGSFGKYTQVPEDSPFASLLGSPANFFFDSSITYGTDWNDAINAAFSIGKAFGAPWASKLYQWIDSDPSVISGSTYTYKRVSNYIGTSDLRKYFILSEPEIYGDQVDPILLGNGLEHRSYQRNWLIQHAYQDALQSVPRLNDNSVSNVTEILSFIKGLVEERRINIPKRWQDAWLAYRYSYNTAKMDVNEAITFMKRTYGTNILGKAMRTYGLSTLDVDGTHVVCTCSLDIKPAMLGKLEDVWRSLYNYGLQPNLYVLWDSIPFSFMVDWLIPVGDFASNLDLQANVLKGQYDIRNVVFSLKYTREAEPYKVSCYTRWSSAPLKQLNDFYWFDRPASSNKIKSFRIIDTASILVG